MKRSSFLLAGFLALLASAAQAADYGYIGTNNTSYDATTSWSDGVVPGATDNITGFSTANASITLSTAAHSINNITQATASQVNTLFYGGTAGTYNVLGTLTVSNSASLIFRGNGLSLTLHDVVINGGNLDIGGVASTYTGIGNLSQAGTNSITLTGSSANSVLSINVTNSYSLGALNFDGSNSKNVYLDANTNATAITATVAGLSTADGSSGTTRIYGSQDNATAASHGAHNVTLNINTTGANTYATSAQLIDYQPTVNSNTAYTNSVLSVIKSGTGTQKLSAASTYSGGTIVQQGKLVVNNATGSGTGTGAVTVSNGATLAGTGIIAPTAGNNVTINGTLAPGDTAGTLTFNLSSGSKLAFGSGSTLSLTLGTSSSEVSFSTAGDWLTGSGNVSLSLSLGTGFSYSNTYNVFDNVTTTGFTFASITGYDTNSYSASVAKVGNSYTLSFSAVPEPSTYALFIGGLALFILSRRRMAATFRG
ncbi:MAG: autotransporter-associated beta strand repeat-containing protein [Verrucomicrobium sp.]|nr:autotransporter-associated beta strand repeat-containing protein [Verrucomicrobium sp.]